MNLYETLRVSEKATREEITSSYKRLAFEHHPNFKDGDDSEFLEVTRAFRILRNDKLRYHYDMFGDFALTYLEDNHAAEFISNLYDRKNLTLLIMSSTVILAFLFFLPWTFFFVRRRIPYSVVFSPLYGAVLMADAAAFRMVRFLREKSQYRSEQRDVVFAALKVTLFGVQVFSTAFYYDMRRGNFLPYLVPAAILVALLLFEKVAHRRAGGRVGVACMLALLAMAAIDIALVCALLSNIPAYLKSLVPAAFVLNSPLLGSTPLLGRAMISLLTLFPALSALCFSAKKFVILGLCSAALFDLQILLFLGVVLSLYRRRITSQSFGKGGRRNLPFVSG